jgi:hypothetical protein
MKRCPALRHVFTTVKDQPRVILMPPPAEKHPAPTPDREAVPIPGNALAGLAVALVLELALVGFAFICKWLWTVLR